MADSASASPLSSHASSEFAEDVKTEEREPSIDALDDDTLSLLMPPAKRQRTRRLSNRSSSIPPVEIENEAGDISSDTSGDIPYSPTGEKDDDANQKQVTVCKWRKCTGGDLGNTDRLVAHIKDEHIGTRQKKYTCEWEGCEKLSCGSASGYALKAHMRKHTGEKPYMCFLPECDRSFTRIDAQSKHMRTVHGIDYDTPSDPIPRNHSSAPSKTQRLKLYVKSKPPQNNGRGGGSGDAEVDDDATICTGTDVDADPLPALPFDYPPDLGFTKEELAMRPDQLFRLVRRQLHWTEEENKALCEEVKMLIIKRKKEWQAKELILANMMEAELATAVHHGVDIGQVINLKDDLPYPMLPMSGPTPWYRIVDSEARDEAPDGGNGGDRASATQES